MSSPLNALIDEQDDEYADITDSSFNISCDEMKQSMRDEPFIEDKKDSAEIKEILNTLNDISILSQNKEDDFKEIISILRTKNESGTNLNSLININLNTRKLISLKGNVLVNSMNNSDPTYSSSPYRKDHFIDENSVRQTSTPVRLGSNFSKRVAFDYNNLP
jgi:hypothetical protein